MQEENILSIVFDNSRVGIRKWDTNELLAVYPEKVSGNFDEIKHKVFDWFYQQNCSAEDELRGAFVDTVADFELEGIDTDKWY